MFLFLFCFFLVLFLFFYFLGFFFGIEGNKFAVILPVREVVFPPPRECVPILTHIRNPTPGCFHDLKSV